MKTLTNITCRFTLPMRAVVLACGLLAAAPGWSQETLLRADTSPESLLRAESSFSIASRAQATREPAGLRNAANAGLKKMISEISAGLTSGSVPEGFPFDVSDFSQLKSATLGLGFEVHTTTPQKLLAGGATLDKMVQGNGIWNFVVLAKERPIALLEMAKVDGQWQVQGAGGAKLAQDVYQAAQNHGGKSAFRFVRIYQASADLLEVQDNQAKARYVPLIAARESLHMEGLTAAKDKPLPASNDLLPGLQEAVRKNLAAHANR